MIKKNTLLWLSLCCVSNSTFASSIYQSSLPDNSVTDILARAPLEQTHSSFTIGAALGVNSGSLHTQIVNNDGTFEAPEGLVGGIAEANLGYAFQLPLQLYSAIEAAFDGRSDAAELETGDASTSYTFRIKSTYNGSFSGGWMFNRGDLLYLKGAMLRTNIERKGAATATTGTNFDRSYRDSGYLLGLGFMMPTDQYTYLRYELIKTPSYGTYSNQLGGSTFKYKGSGLGFKVGYNFYFSPFKGYPTDYTAINVNGPYAGFDLQNQTTQIDFQNKVPFAGGTQTRVEKFIRPASSNQYSYHIGYSSAVASQNLYIALDYENSHLLSYNKRSNLFRTQAESFYYQPYRSKTYSAVFGFRPHPADLFFGRIGSTELEIHRLNANDLQTIENKTLSKGILVGFGFETSLNSYLSIKGEYDYSSYDDTTTNLSEISTTNHAISAGLLLRP